MKNNQKTIIMKNKGTLNEKVESSIEFLKKAERLAIELNPKGFVVAFSGGKDSIVMLDLVRRANVRHVVVHSVTGIDSPTTMYFMRDNYPEIKYIHQRENVLQLIERFGLPKMGKRYCCRMVKENVGVGSVVLTGVRAAESVSRAKGAEVEVYSRRKENLIKGRKRSLEGLYDMKHECIRGKDRVMIKPIFDWSTEDVWNYIMQRGLPKNPQYGQVGRVGCMYCPFASEKQIKWYEKEYPVYKKRVMLAVKRFWDRYDEHVFDTPEEYYEWWRSKMSVVKYKRLRGMA